MDTSKIKEISKGVKEIKNAGKIVWGGYIDKTGTPGPKRLVGGNADAGFFGECPTSDFITGDELARLIGLTAGTSQYSNEPWLKFSYMGKVEFIAKKPFRYRISWNSINSVNAVYGDRTVQIKRKKYKIRLIKGKTEGKQDDISNWNGFICHNSEWNRLMLPIHKNAPRNWRYPENVESPTEDWEIKYSDNDLIVNNGNGFGSWCQECGDSSSNRLLRGGFISSSSLMSPYSDDHYIYGWRPVLELVR